MTASRKVLEPAVDERRRTIKPALGMLVALVFVAVALGRPAPAQAVGELSYDGCFGAGAGCTVVGGGPLTGADSVAVSPNGGSVYVTGRHARDEWCRYTLLRGRRGPSRL